MASIIFLGTEAEAIQALQAALPSGCDQTVISTGQGSLAARMSEAAAAVQQEKLLFIDARLRLANDQMSSLLRAAEECDADLGFLAIPGSGDSLDLEEVSGSDLVRQFVTGASWPTAAVVMRRALLDQSDLFAGETAAEILAGVIIRASADNYTVSALDLSPIPAAVHGLGSINTAAASRLLNTMVSSTNIEDLFPDYDWTNHQEESAAASYHSLAALFLKSNDLESALACLKLGDQFEDSPRALALRGLIQVDRGEILGAVANMVSSLQGYELRKKDDGAHFITFQPGDLKIINDKLSKGLEALNHRNNEAAFSHFAEAVFSFDPFFRQFGVDRVKISE